MLTLALGIAMPSGAAPAAPDGPLDIPWFPEVTYAHEQSDPTWLRDDAAIEDLASIVSLWSQALSSTPPSSDDVSELRLDLLAAYQSVTVDEGEFYYTWAIIGDQLRRVCHPKIQVSVLDGSLQDEALVLFPAPVGL
jgi:hypothetical protein